MRTQPVQTRTEKLGSEIADAILSGEFPPGSRLDEQMLAGRFGVSRTPVREVLRELAASGLVEMRPRRGAIVAGATSSEVDTLFGAMAELEATCARLCALGMTQVERRRLELLHDRMAEIVEAGDRDAYSNANQLFHTMIYEGCHNRVLTEMALSVRRRVAPFRHAQFRAPGRLPRSHTEHGTVVDAILAADAAAAHAAMLRHVTLVEDAFEQLSAALETPGH
jgi:DNA-binding GntR family transcriptional regulator